MQSRNYNVHIQLLRRFHVILLHNFHIVKGSIYTGELIGVVAEDNDFIIKNGFKIHPTLVGQKIRVDLSSGIELVDIEKARALLSFHYGNMVTYLDNLEKDLDGSELREISVGESTREEDTTP